MTIHAPGRELFVVRSVSTTSLQDILICRDEGRADERLYTLLIYKEPSRIYDAMTMFMQIKRRGITPDFADCFSMNGSFYVLFLYHAENPMMAQLERRELMQRERLEAACGILKQILIQDLPNGILLDCLSGENLQFDTSLTVSFGYFLRGAEGYRIVERPAVMEKVAEILTALLGREAKMESEEGVNAEPILEKLRAGQYESWAAAYAEFRKWYDVVRSQVESEEARIENAVTRFWRVVSRIVGVAKPILAVALVALSIGYMVYTLLNPPVVQGAKRGEIRVVGDIVLPESEPQEGEGGLLIPWELGEAP